MDFPALTDDQKSTLAKYNEFRISTIETTFDTKVAPVLDQLISQIKEIHFILGDLTTDCLTLQKQNQEFEKRIHALENVVKPDKTDVHNINRRIELLAQRIAELESRRRWFK